MKIIDKTALQNEKGEIGLLTRLQGALKYGFSWYPELQAQKVVIAKLDRLLERGFVLIRNFTLPNSEIVIPLTLLGPGGVQVIYATHARGFFEAKGGEWNIGQSGSARPAGVNLLMRVARLARAFQVYLQRQQIALPAVVEPVLIAADPGAHIESLRPVARVVQSDAINAFAAALLQARPVMQTPYIHDIAERIINPRSAEELKAMSASPPTDSGQPSRAKAIFDAAESAPPINPADLSFALEEEAGSSLSVPPGLRETSPARPYSRLDGPARTRRFGMSPRQTAFLVFLLMVECFVVIGFIALFASSR